MTRLTLLILFFMLLFGCFILTVRVLGSYTDWLPEGLVTEVGGREGY
jgi:hypothetical protein